ncbi:Alpha/Beta hydrolase protein [Astrocystis sublimbata]|nr:Alpha/Beta hydrolase protein [Astrocystis sublimbata]
MHSQIPLAFTALSSAWTQASSTCQDLRIPVSVEKTATGEFSRDMYSDEIFFSLAERKILVSNTYEMAARLCIPDNNQGPHADTLQLLVHGASFNKLMWDSEYQPERYSWVQRMMHEGYPTLAIDLVGAGNSTFPDGLFEVQTQMYVETIHDLIQKLRRGEVAGRSWEKIAYVGFSIGGMVATTLTQQYPDDVDALVLHAITWDTSWIYPAFLSGLQAPARQIDPEKWGHLPVEYQTQSTREGRIVACFAGDYDHDITELDWQTRDFDTFGAAITFTYHLVTAPEYSGPVFLGIGERDSTFCGGRYCREQPYEVYRRFPKAKAHDIKVYKETGHAIIYHYSGLQLMADTLAFLESAGL